MSFSKIAFVLGVVLLINALVVMYNMGYRHGVADEDCRQMIERQHQWEQKMRGEK